MNDNYYIVFADVKDFSQLNTNRLRAFQTQFNHELYQRLKPYIERAKVINTWGDAIFAVFKNGHDAVLFMLNYRDFFATTTIGKHRLQPRIAASFGKGVVEYNPIGNFDDMLSMDVTDTSRLEPITRPGEVFVTEEFVQQFKHLDLNGFAFDKLGEVKLAKSLKTKMVYRLRRKTDPKQVIDGLYRLNLDTYLPPIRKDVDKEQKSLLDLLADGPKSGFIDFINSRGSALEQEDVPFLYELAQLSKKKGFFEQGLKLLDLIENAKSTNYVDSYHPIRYTSKFKKLKANILTRLGKYSQASQLISELWYGGFKDTDTLCMLAAQYKRQAIFGQEKIVDLYDLDIKVIDKNLLQRAAALYIEAFRIKYDDYYPIINAAYLFAFSGDKSVSRSKELASYIRNAWINQQGKDWWLDATLAETEILNGKFESALTEFEQAIKKHNPSRFELLATFEQIELYSHICNKTNKTAKIQKLLSTFIH